MAFKPRSLKNLMLYDEMPSLSPIVDMKVLDATGTAPIRGRGWMRFDESGDFLVVIIIFAQKII